MRRQVFRHLQLVIILFAASSFGFGQKASSAAVNERDVRAQMQFLAGDALQGRGSGTIFERIAAEYIGTQFMQFGLEPAGEIGPDGKQTFVQTVTVPGREAVTDVKFVNAFAKPPVFGTDVIVFAMNSKQISGPLQKLRPGTAATKGSIVLLMLGPDDKFDQAMIGKLQQDGAGAILMAETSEIRANWSSVAGRKVNISRRGPNLLALSKDSAAALSTVADGS